MTDDEATAEAVRRWGRAGFARRPPAGLRDSVRRDARERLTRLRDSGVREGGRALATAAWAPACVEVGRWVELSTGLRIPIIMGAGDSWAEAFTAVDERPLVEEST